MPGDRTIAERDREARIRGDLIGDHMTKPDRLEISKLEGGDHCIVLHSARGIRVLGGCALSRDAKAMADAVALVLRCPVVCPEETRDG